MATGASLPIIPPRPVAAAFPGRCCWLLHRCAGCFLRRASLIGLRILCPHPHIRSSAPPHASLTPHPLPSTTHDFFCPLTCCSPHILCPHLQTMYARLHAGVSRGQGAKQRRRAHARGSHDGRTGGQEGARQELPHTGMQTKCVHVCSCCPELLACIATRTVRTLWDAPTCKCAAAN